MHAESGVPSDDPSESGFGTIDDAAERRYQAFQRLMTRRYLLITGGSAVGLTALMAACGQPKATPQALATAAASAVPQATAASKVPVVALGTTSSTAPAAAPTAAPTAATSASTNATTAAPTATAVPKTAPAAAPNLSGVQWLKVGPVSGIPDYTRKPTGSGIKNSIGVELPKDAAPADKQIVTLGGTASPGFVEWFKKIYGIGPGWDLVQEPLCRFDKYYNTIPGAADSWEVSSDGMLWKFGIRNGMTWSDGKPLTAHDFVYSFQRGADPKTGFDFGWFYSSAIKNWDAVAAGKMPLDQLGVYAPDDGTFVIESPAPVAYVPQLMTTSYPSPKQAIDKYGDAWSTKLDTFIYSGPYIFKDKQLDGPYTMAPNPHYGGIYKPYINELRYRPVGGDALAAYQKGEIDAVGLSGSGGDLALALGNPELAKQVHQWEDFATYYVAFNTHVPPFDKQEVRQAWSHAIDRDLLAKGAIKYIGFPGATMLPPGFPAYDKAQESVQNFDPAKAKKLMADGGYPNGQGFPAMEMWLRGEATDVVNAAANVAAQLKANLGITVTVKNQDQKVFTTELNKPGADKLKLALVPYAYDWVDASNLLQVFQAAGRHQYDNQQYNDLLKQAASPILPISERNKLYDQAQQILLTDAPAVFLWHRLVSMAWKPTMKGTEFEPVNGVARWIGNERLEIAEFQMYVGKAGS